METAKQAKIIEEQPHLRDTEICMVSWVYTDDGDGNKEFGDLTHSYCSRVALSKDEQRSIKKMLKRYYDSGHIDDVYVGPESTTISSFLTETALIGQCLPALD